LAQVHGSSRHGAGGIHRIGMAGNASQCFFHTFKFTDGAAELGTHGGVTTHGAAGQFGHARKGGGQGDGAASSQTFHQHAPALASHVGTTNNEFQRHEHVFAAGGAVHEHGIQGEVTA